MSIRLTVQGRVRADGTLDLDDKVLMPAGQVLVTVQPLPQPQPDDPFWQCMEQIWAGQKDRGHVPRSVEEVEAERQAFREEWDEHQAELEQLHLECDRQRPAGQPREPQT